MLSMPAPKPWREYTASPELQRYLVFWVWLLFTFPALDLSYGCICSSQGLNCSFVLEMVNNIRALRSETELLLAGKMALVS